MLNLVIKDFKIVNKRIYLIILYALFISALFQKTLSAGTAYLFGIFIISYGFYLYSSGYNDRYKAEVIWNSLPVKREQVVISKYISVVISIMLGFCIILAGMVLLKPVGLKIERYPDLNDFTIEFIILGTLYSILFPIGFKFGSKVTNTVSQIIMLSIILLPNLLVTYVKKHPDNNFAAAVIKFLINGPGKANTYLLLAMTLLLLFSLILSIIIYKKRDI